MTEKKKGKSKKLKVTSRKAPSKDELDKLVSLNSKSVNWFEVFRDLPMEELHKVNEALRYRFKERSKIENLEKRLELKVGMKVKFVSHKTGKVVKGKLTKIGRTKASVTVGNINWRVPLSMLEVA